MSLAGFSRTVHLRGLALGDKRAARERYATPSRPLHPILGRQLLRDLTPEMILGALMRIREEKARTARTVRSHLIALLGEAVSDGLIPENPADRLETRIPAPAKLTTAGGDAKAARVLDQLPAFLEAMMTTSRRPNLMRLLRFMLLTLRAPQECRLARWEQFDIPGRSWTFPLRQHEGNEIQRFELFDVHLDILHEARHVARGDGTGWVFDATAGMDRPYEVNATYKARRDLGFDIEVLDFRRAHEFWVRGRDGDGSLKGWIDLLLKSKAAPSPNPGISLP